MTEATAGTDRISSDMGNEPPHHVIGLRTLHAGAEARELFAAADAWIDKCEIAYRIPFECASREALEDVVSTWCHIGQDTDNPDLADWLKASPGHQLRGNAYDLKIAPGWHFKGSGKIKYTSSANRWALELSLQLNPTWWLRNIATTDMNTLMAMSSAELLWRGAERHGLRLRDISPSQPVALDRNDNYLPNDRIGSNEPASRRAYRGRLLRCYLNAITGFLGHKLYPPNPDVPSTATRLTSPSQITNISVLPSLTRKLPKGPSVVTLRQAEVYFDVAHNDALTMTAAIGTVLTSLSGRSQERWVSATTAVNTRVFTDYLTGQESNTGIAHCVYAKCSDRIRFELRYYTRDHIGQSIRLQGESSFNTVAYRLNALYSDAQRRLERWWGSIRMHLNENTEPEDYIDFARRYARANLGALTDKVVPILANVGGIVEGDVPRHVLRSLIDVGILSDPAPPRHGGPKRYPLLPCWCAMFDEIKRLRSHRIRSLSNPRPTRSAQHVALPRPLTN